MSFNLTEPKVALSEITYRAKKRTENQVNESTEIESEAKNIRVGEHKESGRYYLVLSFSMQLDATAFFLYAEGVFRVEITCSPDEDLDSAETRKRMIEFARAGHQELVKVEVRKAADTLLSLTGVRPV